MATERHAGLAEGAGTDDARVLIALADLGFTPATAGLVHLLPLVEVAWVDGAVSAAERNSILEMAATRGIEPGSAGHRHLLGWLDDRPPGTFFEAGRRVLRQLLERLPADKRNALARGVVAGATRVAAVSGRFLGLGRRISATEQRLLDRIAHEFLGGAKDRDQASRRTRRNAAP